MKNYVIRFFSLLLVCLLLCANTPVVRAENINLGVNIQTGTDEITVTIDNSSETNIVLAEERPSLVIDCPFSPAYVKYGDAVVASTLADGKITFKIEKGGVYTICKGTAPVDDTAAPVISGVENGKTYYTTQTATVTDENLDVLTLNGEAATSPVTLEGNKTATYIIEATDKAGNKTSVTVNMLPIAALEEDMDGLTTGNVTSANKEDVQAILTAVNEALQQDISEAEEEKLTAIKDKAESLLAAIDEAADALKTGDIQKVENKDETNVTLEDTADLTKAKEDLEEALTDANKGNYTAAEQAEIQAEIDRLEKAIETIAQTEDVIDAIDQLPDSVEPDLEEAEEKKVRDAKTAFDQLSAHQKSLMQKSDKDKLERLFKTLTAYEIVEGDGSRWKKGSDKTLTFTANGPARKFKELRIDDKVVGTGNYTYKEGSTVVTLKASYLEKLSSGKHAVQVVFNDGKTDEVSFRISGRSTSPATGDNSQLMLVSVVFMTSLLCMAAILLRKKGKYQK